MKFFCFDLVFYNHFLFFFSLAVDATNEANKNSAEHEAKSLVETVKEKAAEA